MKWQSLKIGDKIQVTHWPVELRKDTLHAETTALYTWLINTGSILTIVEIDSFGLPYGRIVLEDRTEYIAINHSGIKVMRN